ncbi:MAG: FMN-binding protein [Kiritimatiellae bacterium]|nr:FMN-binding protein [Kiritimatiellia bacterium]MDD4341499.1 FMN-binding protein [Kiritimatiellia bacterium]
MNKKSPVYVLGFMAAICAVFGTGIAIVNYSTQGLLARNATLHRNRVLCRAFDLPVEGTSAEAYQAAVDAHLAMADVGPAADGRTRYTEIGPGRNSVGYTFGGMGFWDRIKGIVVLSPDLQSIRNIQFFDQKETPGLGARIEEPWFTEQFKGLQIDWDNPRGDRIVVGATPDPDPKNRVDAITGATQTSMALMRFLNDELAQIRELNMEMGPLDREH